MSFFLTVGEYLRFKNIFNHSKNAFVFLEFLSARPVVRILGHNGQRAPKSPGEREGVRLCESVCGGGKYK